MLISSDLLASRPNWLISLISLILEQLVVWSGANFDAALLFNATFRVLCVGTTVVTITASDADDQTYGNSAKLVYSILQGQPYFSVDSENGEPDSAGRRQLFPPERRRSKRKCQF